MCDYFRVCLHRDEGDHYPPRACPDHKFHVKPNYYLLREETHPGDNIYMGISPVVVLFSLIFWGYVWGVVGMVLAVPIAVLIKIVLENISELKPLSVLMSDYRA